MLTTSAICLFSSFFPQYILTSKRNKGLKFLIESVFIFEFQQYELDKEVSKKAVGDKPQFVMVADDSKPRLCDSNCQAESVVIELPKSKCNLFIQSAWK